MASGSSSFSGTSATVMGDDSSNPYFLYHEESLRMSLVKQPLTKENYHSWSRLMVIALTAKNKIGSVNGSITAPGISSPLYNAWERCNAMVLLWVWNSLSEQIAASVIYLDIAREVVRLKLLAAPLPVGKFLVADRRQQQQVSKEKKIQRRQQVS